MTKEELIKLLQEDNKPMNSEVEIYLECLNDDTDLWGKITDLRFNKRTKALYLSGEYEEV